MRRREFLKRAGCFVASASVVGIWSCESEGDADEGSKAGAVSFPQGVASGDPQAGSIVLWTRAVPAQGDAPVRVRLEISESEGFQSAVLKNTVEATKASDFTVRILVEDLSPNRTYYYRFVAGADRSRVGRTRTAPEADADVAVRFAWVSCQDYASNFYGPYRRMINEDKAAAEDEQLHFVLHVGDFVYETRDADFMTSVTDDLQRVELKSAAGKPRAVPEFPSGQAREDGANYAITVDDYRHIYKTYLSDPDLQDARARWPFINVWDDHEFTDDCWQTQANYTRAETTDEPSQKRRVAASQAWFEYIPAALSDAKQVGDVAQRARDFKPVQVEDAPYDAVVEVDEPNNVKAISAITIYRNLRWGKHLELVLTDDRSYRSDHALAEQTSVGNILIFDPRVGLPKDVVNAFDAGREANGGKPADTVDGFSNTRKNEPPGTMLGSAQKAWWKDVMKASTATFKVWGGSVPVLRILLDGSEVPLIMKDLLLSADAWDGYNSERKELMAFLRDNAITNVISLSGDHHAHYAGIVYDDYDAPSPSPVMVDFATAGVSSNSQWSSVAAVLQGAFDPSLASVVEPVKQLIVYDSTPLGGSTKAVVNLNTLIRYGSKAANVAAKTHDLQQIQAARDPKINAHLRYADSHSFGYGLAHVTADGVNTQLISIERSFTDLEDESPELRSTASFRVPRVDKLSDLSLAEPMIEGQKPFPLV